MFDIGGPEFLVIAIVALVVLGPERLPTVMRQAGRFYRQAREMLNQYTAEAQRMFDEGLREVEEVGTTISSTWQDATSTPTTAPPPALRQLPPPLQQPDTAANAGPWALAAWYRDTHNDVEPQPRAQVAAPFALPLARPASDAWIDDLGAGGPTLMGLAPMEPIGEDGAAPLGLAIPEVPPAPQAAPQPVAPPAPSSARRTRPARTHHAPDESAIDLAEPELLPEPVGVVAGNGALHHEGTPAGAAGASDPEHVRQETLIQLYRTGDITLDKAAEFLGISQSEFRALLKRK